MMQANKELLEELEAAAKGKVTMAGLPCPTFDIPQAEEPEPQGASNGPTPIRKMNRKQRRAAAKKAIHKAKRAAKLPEPKTHYICDPSKNIKCAKTNCHINGGPCKCTEHLKYAKQPVEKVQMIIPVSGEERRDLMKQYAKELKKQ